MVSAIASNVLFCLCSRSILLSRLESTAAIACCSGRGGRRISISLRPIIVKAGCVEPIDDSYNFC
jgi:hypothetical protein